VSECNCGSKKHSWWKVDGYGIPLVRVCKDCERKKMKRFRPDIDTRYEADEPIDENE
jgi:hypothetical protein